MLKWLQANTLGTYLLTRFRGSLVGEDDHGNRYYRQQRPGGWRAERRWVVYAGYAEASAVPPGWHGWMHHRVNEPPVEGHYRPHEWEKPHNPNLTGTSLAYHPPGSIAAGLRPLPPPPDYQAWKPD